MTSLTDDSDVTSPDTKPVEAQAPLPTAPDTSVTTERLDFEAEFVAPFRKVARPHPIIGPGLWIFGAMLWAYVVLGEYTTAGFIGEAISVSLLTFAVGACWYFAVQRCSVPSQRKFVRLGRALVPGFIALLLLVGCALFMNFVGESSHQNQDVPMTLAFMVIGILAFFGGRRLTVSVDKQPSPNTFAHLPLIGAVLISLGAILHLIVAN
jgi:hypothetical protein